MANTTFNGPVRSENGFESIVKDTSTGVVSKMADLHASTGGNSVVADAAKKAGSLLLSSIASIGAVMKTYQATVTVANGANTTINPVIKNSVIITSNVDDPGNVTITYTVSADSQTLNFSREVNPFVTGQIDDNTLFKTYYSDYISDLFSYNRRLVKVKAILPQSFLLQYKLSDTLIISNEAFIINKITTNLQTGESSLELLNKL